MVHKISRYTFYSDAWHGWLKVSLKDLKELGLIDDITQYSYIKGDYAYLEEDHDANLFIKAYEKKTSKKVKGSDFKESIQSSGRSPIRYFRPYTPESAKKTLRRKEI